MNVFIDTNIFLAFFHFTTDDLEELKKLSILLEKKELRLFLPDQVRQEFLRNRDSRIADALKRLRDQKLSFQFPQFCKGYEEYEQLRNLQKNHAKVHAKLMMKVSDDIGSLNLKADILTKELFDLGERIQIDDALRERARTRVEVGNPPGKRGSLGDAINWEALLQAIPEDEDIYFITDDKDYTSPLDGDTFNTFLLEEWAETKSSKLIFYKSLSEFFKDHFPQISLASELEKDLLIRDLANSPNWETTHKVIAKLNRYTDFTAAQLNAIVEAAISNNQIYWIINDWDVNQFLSGIVERDKGQIDPDNLAVLLEYLTPEKHEDINEIPF